MSKRCVIAGIAFLAGASVARAQTKPVFVDGMAQDVPAFSNPREWIHQLLWVETDFDSDRDGRMDRVAVDVTRPRQTDTEGLKVPILYSSSPYFAGTSPEFVGWDVQTELNAPPKPRGHMAQPQYNATREVLSQQLLSWVSRGFAVVHSDAPGTGRSQGCPTVGDYPERAPMKFVIDWLNGRAKGYTTPTGSEEVRATSWSTGKVGMIGTSYEGTLPLAAATTGVQGLEVVVPVSPNTSYYHYYRSNGLVRSPGGYLGEDVDVLYDFIASGDTATRAKCDAIWKNGIFAGAKGQDRATGDFNDFWAARDLLPFVKNIKAAVLLTHGLNDYNVLPDNTVRIYDEMRARGLKVSMYLHQGGHGGNPPADMLNRWFSHYLYGVDNGVEKDPPVYIVQDAAMQSPRINVDSAAMAAAQGRGRGRVIVRATPFPSFPVPGTAMVTLRPGAGGSSVGTLSTAAGSGTEKLTDDVTFSASVNASAPESPHRLLYATAELKDTVHISGAARLTLRVSSSRPAANLSVLLVMLPYDSARVGSANHVGVVARGWADIRNYKSLTNGGVYQSKIPGEALTPGKFYDVTFDLEPTDEFIPAGKRLALMIMSSDREFTLWPAAGTELTVDLTKTSIAIPIVGGSAAFTGAGGR